MGVDDVSGVSRLAQCVVVAADETAAVWPTTLSAYLLSPRPTPPLPAGSPATRMSPVMSAWSIDQHKFVTGVGDAGNVDVDGDGRSRRSLCRI